MFEVGFTELLLIFALSLIVLGPERLPKLAQQVGRWVGRARAMARQFRDQLDEEAHNLETKMNIDPGVDTSMDPKPAPPPPESGVANVPATVPAAPPEPEEDFYPPDHHMHPSQRETVVETVEAVEATADVATEPAPEAAGGQAELDLSTPRDDGRDPKP